jgi:replicative superfamily II helicase
MQMMGRAGRPQFGELLPRNKIIVVADHYFQLTDKEGVAIILCEPELEQKYKALANGTTKLESSLHLHLDEHLNSEIGLGTITHVTSAKEWLRNSFLWRRLQKNPKHYAIGKNDNETWQSKIDDLVMQSVKKLKATELVEYESDGDGDLCSTEYGDIMSKVRPALFQTIYSPTSTNRYSSSTFDNQRYAILLCRKFTLTFFRILDESDTQTLETCHPPRNCEHLDFESQL